MKKHLYLRPATNIDFIFFLIYEGTVFKSAQKNKFNCYEFSIEQMEKKVDYKDCSK